VPDLSETTSGHGEKGAGAPEDEPLDSSPQAQKDQTPADKPESDPILFLMQKVNNFQSRLSRSLSKSVPGPGSAAPPVSASPHPETPAASRRADEEQKTVPYGYEDEIEPVIADSPASPGPHKEIPERLEQALRKAEEIVRAIETTLLKVHQCQAEMDRWRREFDSLETLFSKIAPMEAGRTQELTERFGEWRRRLEKSRARIEHVDDMPSSAARRAGRIKKQYSALAALLLERYCNIQQKHAADPRIASRLDALEQIRDLAGRLRQEDSQLIASLGENMQEVLIDVGRACSNMILELRKEPPPPPAADAIDPGLRHDPAALNRMADYLIQKSRFPSLFMDPEELYLERLRKALTIALIDYHGRLETHRRGSCPQPADFNKRFQDFAQETLIPRMVNPLEVAARDLPEYALQINQILRRILDLALLPE